MSAIAVGSPPRPEPTIFNRLRIVVDPRTTLSDLSDRIADAHGDDQLFEEKDGRAGTARELGDQAAKWSGGLRSKIAPGDRVVLALPNSYTMFIAALAVLRAGGVVVPVNLSAASDELDHIIEQSGATLVIRDVSELTEGPAGEPAAANSDDVAAIFYTSGTTGRPKGAELTHKGLIGGVRSSALWPDWLRRDEAVVGLPVAHIMGFAVLLSLAVARIPVFFLPKFRPVEVLDAIERRRSTVFIGVPAMYRMLHEAGAEDRDLRSVRVWASGADAMPAELVRAFQRMGATVTLPIIGHSLGEAVFAEGYGMVELSGGVAAKVSLPFLSLPLGSVLGFPLPPNRMRVAGQGDGPVAPGQIGELQVKGPGVLRGYHDDAAATKKAVTDDGWLRTGDLARRGPFGVVLFEGRANDRIKSGGYSVFAGEIERVLEEHPDVLEASAVGIPDERLGEVPVAAVRIGKGSTVSSGDLADWANARLASYKRPAEIRIVTELPRTGTDKVKRNAVKALFADDGAATAAGAGASAASPEAAATSGSSPAAKATSPAKKAASPRGSKGSSPAAKGPLPKES